MPGDNAGLGAQIDTHSAPLDMGSFETFMAHPSIAKYVSKYERTAPFAARALEVIDRDMKSLNEEYYKSHSRVLFTVLEPRVKSKKSFFEKFYAETLDNSTHRGISSEMLDEYFLGIHDIAGIRFACPYFDEVKSAVSDFLRPRLKQLNYAVDLTQEGLLDRDYLDDGDKAGYRSYHFFVKVPTPVDIWGETKPCLVEVQGRSELQHVWAVKSHDLLYKNDKDRCPIKPEIRDDMKQISHNLRSADHFLTRIRDAVRGEGIQ